MSTARISGRGNQQQKQARFIRGKFGRPVLTAPPEAPAMTPKQIKAILNQVPIKLATLDVDLCKSRWAAGIAENPLS